MSQSSWQPVLAVIEDSLAAWLSRAVPPEEQPVLEPSSAPSSVPPDAGLKEVEACLRQVEEEAGVTDTMLTGATTALAGWRERASALRRLLEGSPRSV
jgi:hypothetical protein